MTNCTRLAWVALIVWTSAGTAHAGVRAGNAGDPFDIFLNDARQTLARALADALEQRPTSDASLHNYCAISGANTPAEIETCVAFIFETASQIIARRQETPLIPWLPDEEDDFTADYGDGERPAAARTDAGWADPIYFHYERTRNLFFADLVTLMAHEFGHKVVFRGQHLTDVDPVEAFEHGHELLNAAANALRRYAMYDRLLFSLDHGMTTTKEDWFWCTLTFDDDTKVVLHPSGPRQYPNHNEAEYLAGFGQEGDGIDISRWTSPYFPDQRLFLKLEIQERDGCATPGEGAARIEVTVEEAGFRRIVGESVSINPICVAPSMEILLRSEGLLISCTYDEFHWH